MNLRTITLPPGLRGALALRFPRPDGPGSADRAASSRDDIVALLSLASEGDMAYTDPASAANRRRFLSAAGVDPGRVLGLALAHSRNVLFPADAEEHRALAAEAASSGSPDDPVGADGIVLGDPELVATITVADCMPIWLLDRDSGSFGVLHSGWKGTGILSSAVEALVRLRGSRPSSMAAILGPAIGSCCYEVPAERARDFAREFGDESAFARGGAWVIDLRAANVGIARSLRIGEILSVEACTSCDERLGSYRRQGKDAFTRMLAACGRFPLVHPIVG